MEGVRAFIEDYRETWEAVIGGSAPVDALDRFFNTPCFMVGAEGQVTLFDSPGGVTGFNEKRVESFREGGVTHRALGNVRIQSQGRHMALAIVNWKTTRADGSFERGWRQYYTIILTGDGPRFLVAAFRAEDESEKDDIAGLGTLVAG